MTHLSLIHNKYNINKQKNFHSCTRTSWAKFDANKCNLEVITAHKSHLQLLIYYYTIKWAHVKNITVLWNTSPFDRFFLGGGEVVKEWRLPFLFLELRDEKCHEYFNAYDQEIPV